MVVDAVDRRLAGRIERRHDDAVGVAEAGAELAEEIVHARIAVRLEHSDEPPILANIIAVLVELLCSMTTSSRASPSGLPGICSAM